jgi:hypothetical protein
MGTTNYHRKIIQVLERLHKAHPTYNLGKHLSTAIDDSELWGITDKELFLSLQRYESSLTMDKDHIDEEEIEAIIKDGMNLRKIFLDDEEED